MSPLSFQQPPRLPFRKHKTTPTCPGGLALSQHQQLAAPSSLQLRQGGDRGAPWGHFGGTQPGPGAHPGRQRCGPGPAGRAGAARSPQPPRPSPPRPRDTAPLRPAAPSACAPAPGLNGKGEMGCDIRGGSRHPTQLGDGQRESCTYIVHLRTEVRAARRLKR